MSFEMKLGAGFLATILAAIAICIIAIYGLNETIKSNHIVIADYAQDLILAGRLGVEEESLVATARGFLITGDKLYLSKMKKAHHAYQDNLTRLQKSHTSSDHDQFLLEIRNADEAYERALLHFIQAKSAGSRLRNLSSDFEELLQPKRESLQKSVNNYRTYAAAQLASERIKLSESNRSIFHLVLVVSLIALALAGAMALTITKALSKLHREIQNTAKMREEIVEMVAHDLRNPVSAVALSTELLLKSANSKGAINPSDIKRKCENIKRATDRVNGLINGLLDLAKIKSGTLAIDRAYVSPKEILEDTFNLFENIARERGIFLETQQVPLPYIQCDFDRVVQVFSNLIGNALKYSVSNQKIIFGAYSKGESVVFFVNDKGPGIPEEEQSHIFERYWQSGDQKRSGIGLGLAICKGIVAAHQGEIWLESKVGVGTTFHFSVPASKELESTSVTDESGQIHRQVLPT